MKEDTCQALLDLNRAFYTTFAGDFAATRRACPPGFKRILPYFSAAANVLDVGCGNGRLLAFLRTEGWHGHYVGIDNSIGLLAEAEMLARSDAIGGARFIAADLMAPDWDAQALAALAAPGQATAAAEAIICLAVLQHVPGRANRVRLLAQCGRSLAPNGRLILSTWQFMTSPRLRARVLPWETAGIGEADLEPDDYLVAWGEGAAGRRYCAFISEAELAALAAAAGLTPVAAFYADGHEGNLNLYGVFTTV